VTAELLGPIFLTRASKLLTFLITSSIVLLYNCSVAFFPSGAFFVDDVLAAVAFLVVFRFLVELSSDLELGVSTQIVVMVVRLRFWVVAVLPMGGRT